MNKKLNDFRCNIASMGESVSGFRISSTQINGLSGRLATPEFKFARTFMGANGGTEDVKKMVFVPNKEEQKGKLSMDHMVESSWKSTNCLAPLEESI